MADEYDPALLVHDTLPLVRDAETNDLRFARIGYDDPATWIADASGLPDAAITIHVFDNYQKLDGWMMAAARFGGNHVRISRPPSHGPQIALEVDYSRARNPGSTLDDAVELAVDPLMRDADSMRAMFRSGRNTLAERNRAQQGQDAFEHAWKAEMAVLRELGFSIRSHTPSEGVHGGSPLTFEAPGGISSRYTLHRTPEGYRIAWWASQFSVDEPDLLAELVGTRERLGLEILDEDIAMPVPEITRATTDAAAAAKAALYAETRRLSDIEKGRVFVRQALANDKMMAVLRKARAGATVTTRRMGDPGSQVNPKTGTVQAVPQTHFSTAFKQGWLGLAYPGNENAPLGSRVPLVLTLTPAGVALCDGDQDRARVLARESIETNKAADTRTMAGGDLVAMITDATTWLEDDVREALATVLARKLEASDDLGNMARRGIDFGDSWCLAIAGVVAGVVGLRDDGRPCVLSDSDANAMPGMR